MIVRRRTRGGAPFVVGSTVETTFTTAAPLARTAAMVAIVVAGVAGAAGTAMAQEGAPEIGDRLMAAPAVRSAVQFAGDEEIWVVEQQIRLCEIPAPPFGEQERAAAYAESLRELGLANVRIDAVGNVLGERAGAAARPHLVFSAHLDTVFPPETDVTVSRDGSVLKGPGIADDCRGLAVLLGVVRAMAAAEVEVPGMITFVGTVGEEGLGDLRGVKHLFETQSTELAAPIDRFVSIDGTGLDVTHIGVGSRRYRIAYTGPGGHSFGAFGLANPTHALGRSIAKISEFQVPTDPKTTFNVGRIGGGTSINSIAFESWMEVDMRSVKPEPLARLEEQFLAALQEALDEENARWHDNGKISLEPTLVGDRPAGSTEESSPIVLAAVSVADALGLESELGAGSTDSNIGMSRGVPSITIGGGGVGMGAHSLGESFDTTDSHLGTQRAVLLAIALAQR